jgi:hypothetical protein
MASSSQAQRVVDVGDGLDRPSFLGSHRAIGACTRELGRLSDEIEERVLALAGGIEEKPDIRRSPGRCIVQMGRVALTVAWLRSTLDTVADGELLVIVWRGTVAPQAHRRPERRAQQGTPLGATEVWEEVLSAAATDEASWSWRPEEADVGGYSSAELAERCVERLRVAHTKARAQR